MKNLQVWIRGQAAVMFVAGLETVEVFVLADADLPYNVWTVCTFYVPGPIADAIRATLTVQGFTIMGDEWAMELYEAAAV